jgi:beta-lactamase regulating signal transducer with metallopeptidase domain
MLECALQTSVILLIALFSMPLLRQRSAAVRHCVLSVALLFAAITPAIRFALPAQILPPILRPAPIELSTPLTASTEFASRIFIDGGAHHESEVPFWRRQSSPASLSVTAPIWFGGLSISLLVMLTGLMRLSRIRSHSHPIHDQRWLRLAATISNEYGIRRFVDLLQSGNRSILVTWGFFRPRVILPSGAGEWSEQQVRVVLLHELAHVRRGDWIVQMLAQLLRAVYWFNPLVWIVCNRLRIESERACDDTVLSQSICNHDYAAHLLELARTLNTHGHSWSAALAAAHLSTIERRFAAMLIPGVDRRPVSRLAILAASVIGVFVTLPVVFLTTAAPARPVSVTLQPLVMKTEVVAPSAPALPKPTDLNEFISRSVEAQRPIVSPLDRALYEAAEIGDITQIDSLMRAGANVNAVVPGDGSPLIGAARRGHFDAVRFLLDRGADPNMPVPGDGNPLIMAAHSGHIDVVTLLLDRGANVDEIVPGDENALIAASRSGKLEMVKLLIGRGANVNTSVQVNQLLWLPNGETRSALSEGRKGGHQAITDYLISAGARE